MTDNIEQQHDELDAEDKQTRDMLLAEIRKLFVANKVKLSIVDQLAMDLLISTAMTAYDNDTSLAGKHILLNVVPDITFYAIELMEGNLSLEKSSDKNNPLSSLNLASKPN